MLGATNVRRPVVGWPLVDGKTAQLAHCAERLVSCHARPARRQPGGGCGGQIPVDEPHGVGHGPTVASPATTRSRAASVITVAVVRTLFAITAKTSVSPLALTTYPESDTTPSSVPVFARTTPAPAAAEPLKRPPSVPEKAATGNAAAIDASRGCPGATASHTSWSSTVGGSRSLGERPLPSTIAKAAGGTPSAVTADFTACAPPANVPWPPVAMATCRASASA